MTDLKRIFLLVDNNGDGSMSIKFVLDENLILAMEQADKEGLLDCENHAGCDSDGFHYQIINVPADFTPEIMGISEYSIITPENFLASISSEEISQNFANLNAKKHKP